MLFTIAAAATALVATASASNLERREYNFNSSCDTSQPLAKIVNRCNYPVYLWSIDKQLGCPSGSGLVLETGDYYNENLQSTSGGGVSIKLSKFKQCGGSDHTQLEYKLNYEKGFEGNFLDMSFVDCQSSKHDCPGWHDGYYLKSGNQNGKFPSAVNNEHCPIINSYNGDDAPKNAYVLWDDRQTKFCDLKASMELYLCGGSAPGKDDSPSKGGDSAPSSTSAEKQKPSPKPSPSSAPASSAPASSAPVVSKAPEVAAAAVEATPPAQNNPAATKTQVVYETVYVKRHAHGRRHQHFHA